MTKTKKFVTRILPVIAVLAMLVTSIVLMTGCNDEPVTVVLDNSKLALYDYRVGYISGNAENNTVDLTKAIPNAKDFAIADTTLATISGTTLTALKAGDSRMTYTLLNEDGSAVTDNAGAPVVNEINIHVLDGYTNVDTWDELYTAAMGSGKVCIQSELTVTEGKSINFVPADYENYVAHPDELTIYGNVLKIDSSAVTTAGGSLFSMEYLQATMNLNDLYIVGATPVEDENGGIDLTQFETYGSFFVAYGSDEVFPVFNVTHCLTENSQKHAYMRAAQFNMDGSIMRNGADALLAAETSNVKGAELNINNSVFANSVVSGIILCGWTKIRSAADFCTLNLTGFVDFYNWKNRETARLMPGTESAAGLVNPFVLSAVQDPANDSYFVYEGSTRPGFDEQYLNLAIVRLSSGGQPNDSVINGYEALGYMMDDFPLPSFATSLGLIKSCHVVATQQTEVDWSSSLSNNPTASMSDNTNLNHELVYGREA